MKKYLLTCLITACFAEGLYVEENYGFDTNLKQHFTEKIEIPKLKFIGDPPINKINELPDGNKKEDKKILLSQKENEKTDLAIKNHFFPTNEKNGGSTTCWNEAGKFHKVDPWLLYSIAKVESGFNPLAIGKNTNGTYDIGLMQINNKVWLPVLKKKGITERMLKDACLSVYVGAWILRQNIDQYGYTAFAIGAYNSRTPSKNAIYAKKVYATYYGFAKLQKKK